MLIIAADALGKGDEFDEMRRTLTTHRDAAAPSLEAQTKRLLVAGARAEDVVWMILPHASRAMLAVDAFELVRRSASVPDLARVMSTFQGMVSERQRCACWYLGPDSILFEAIRADGTLDDDEPFGAVTDGKGGRVRMLDSKLLN